MKKLRLASLVLSLLIAVFVGYAWFKIGGSSLTVQQTDQLIPVSKDVFGGPFTLTNHLGETVTDQTYAGQYRLFYFGFTYCPAICPTGLQTITRALKGLGPDAAKVQPIFVTVDPERDTADVMKNYVTMFDPRLVGLTGTPEQIATMLKSYKIYAARVEDPQLSEYTMDHSAFTYFIGPQGNLLHIFKHEDSSDDMTKVMRRWIDTTQN